MRPIDLKTVGRESSCVTAQDYYDLDASRHRAIVGDENIKGPPHGKHGNGGGEYGPPRPGTVADLRDVTRNGQQAPYLAWSQRNQELTEQVHAGAVECCGEWQQPGYYGWCALLSRPSGTCNGRRIDRCPVAERLTERGEWYVSIVEEIEAICKGEIDVWTGYGQADSGDLESRRGRGNQAAE